MKIGEIEEQRILYGQNIPCENGCPTRAVKYLNGTPYCPECLREEQQRLWNANGQFFEDCNGERLYFEVVRKVA